MKNFQLVILNNKTELSEKRRNNTITTKEICIWFSKTFLLRNKKTIVKIDLSYLQYR